MKTNVKLLTQQLYTSPVNFLSSASNVEAPDNLVKTILQNVWKISPILPTKLNNSTFLLFACAIISP